MSHYLPNREERLLIEYISELRHAFNAVKKQYPFHIDAIVILPEHLHCILTLPENDDDFSGRWREIKKYFSRQLPMTEYRSKVRVQHHERGIWQRRFWEHAIRNEEDYIRHVDYIHYNPVKHGWVKQVKYWKYSSFHRFVEKDIYPLEWSSAVDLAYLFDR